MTMMMIEMVMINIRWTPFAVNNGGAKCIKQDGHTAARAGRRLVPHQRPKFPAQPIFQDHLL